MLTDLEPGVVVSAVGAISAVGACAWQTFTSIRARATRAAEAEDLYYCLADDPLRQPREPAIVARVDFLRREDLRREAPGQWLAYLAGRALRDASKSARLDDSNPERQALLTAVPGDAGLPVDDFDYHLCNYGGHDPAARQSAVQCTHAGGLALCAQAAALLVDDSDIDQVLVGGTDSFVFHKRLAALDEQYRLHSARNIDGFLPGEGAAYLALERDGAPQERGLEPAAELVAAAVCRGPARGKETNTGEALTQVLIEVLSRAGEPPLIVCDLNGETARMREWGYALTRLEHAGKAPVQLEHPAQALGDVGAASGPMLIGAAIHLLGRKYRERREAVVFCAGDDGERCAVLIRLLRAR